MHRTGLASDLRVPHLVLVADRTAGTCRMRGPSVVHLVPRAIHLRDTLVLVPLAGRLLHLHPPSVPLESGQNLHLDLATIRDHLCGHLRVLVLLLQSLLYDRLFSEAILSANHEVGVVARDLGCATRMVFAIPLLPPFLHLWRIPTSQDLTTAILVILLYLYGPLRLILHLVSADDNAFLNAESLELRRIDTVIPVEVNFGHHF